MHDTTTHTQQVNKHRKSNQMNHIIYAGMPKEDREQFLGEAIPTGSDDRVNIIKDTVIMVTGIRNLSAQSRKREIVDARHIAMHLMVNYTDLSLNDIGKFFGGKNHATVLHARRKILHLSVNDEGIKDKLTKCIEVLDFKFKPYL
jgi:chromosomal replication initiation ATPase DnaA